MFSTLFSALLPFSPLLLASGMLVSLGAGFVRGFAGFGYAALTAAGLSLFVSPATVVPAVMTLEVVASLSLLRSSLPLVDKPWLRALLIGNFIFLPLGIIALAMLPDNLLRLLIGGALLVSAVFLRLRDGQVFSPSVTLRASAGVGSGLLNGLAASGGVLAAMLMSAARVPPAALRATLIVWLLAAGAYTLLWAALLTAGNGATLLSLVTLKWILLLLPTMWLGVWWGKRSFAKSHHGNFRHQVLNLLIVISSLGVVRALWGLLAH